MNNWKCTTCDANNAEGQRFCGSCGQPNKAVETSAQNSAAEPAPTIMSGYIPQLPAPPLNISSSQNQFQPPNQPNYQSQNQINNQTNQQNYSQSQSFPQNQSQASFSAPSFSPALQSQSFSYSQPETKKSALKPLLMVGGIGGFIVVAVIGFIVWLAVINPYLKEQARIKEQESRQQRANIMEAISLMPVQFIVPKPSTQTYKRTRNFSRSEVIQASKDLPPEMQTGSENVTDASAAEFVNTNNGDQKVVIQIFKFNSPSKAVDKCKQIGLLLQNRRENFNRVDVYGINDSNPTQCVTSAEGKTGGGLLLKTEYGFLYVATGLNDSLFPALLSIENTLTD